MQLIIQSNGEAKRSLYKKQAKPSVIIVQKQAKQSVIIVQKQRRSQASLYKVNPRYPLGAWDSSKCKASLKERIPKSEGKAVTCIRLQA